MPEATTTTEETTTTTETKSDWMTGISDDMKGYIQNKGWKGVHDLANSYLNLEKLRGVPEDRLLKLPESMDAPEARAVWERLGAPKEAKEYGLDPKTVGEHLATDFHEIGVPKDMASKIVAKQAARHAESLEKSKMETQAALAQADLSLKKEWGMAYDQNRAIVDAAARALGISNDEVSAMGSSLGMDKAMKFLHKLGVSTGEAIFVGGQPANNGMLTPESARQRKNELMRDQGFMAKWNAGDTEALKTWTNLHKMMAPGEISF